MTSRKDGGDDNQKTWKQEQIEHHMRQYKVGPHRYQQVYRTVTEHKILKRIGWGSKEAADESSWKF